MNKHLIGAAIIAISTGIAAPAFAISGYGPAPHYNPIDGAPTSQRGQSAQTIHAELASAERNEAQRNQTRSQPWHSLKKYFTPARPTPQAAVTARPTAMTAAWTSPSPFLEAKAPAPTPSNYSLQAGPPALSAQWVLLQPN